MENKKSKIALSLLALALLVPALAACGHNDGGSSTTPSSTPATSKTTSSSKSASSSSKNTATVSGIAITTMPTKLAYVEGEKFDPTGMVVTATYSDASKKVISDYTYDLHDALKVANTSVTITYQGKNASVAIVVSAKVTNAAHISADGTTRYEAEYVDTTHYKYSSSNTSYVVARADASNGEFLAGATGDISAAGYFTFSMILDENFKISMKAAYAQTERWKAQAEDMTKAYTFLIDDNFTVKLTGDHILAARDDITKWDTITYDDFSLAKGTHSFKVSVVANTGKGCVTNHKMFDKTDPGSGWGSNEGRIRDFEMTYSNCQTKDGKIIVYEDEGAFLKDPIEPAYFGCAGVAEIPDLQNKLIALARGGFKHHTTVGVGHYKSVLDEAFKTYLHYDVVDIAK